MRLDKYRIVFGVRGFPLVMVLGLLAKLPVVAIPIVVTLHVTSGLHHGYGQAGLIIGAWTAGFTIGSPIQGRFIHRYGLRPVLMVSIVAQGVFWGLAPNLSYPEFAVGALASGLLLVPGSTVIRLAIGGLVPREHRQAAFAVDSMITEISVMTGPTLAALLATQVSTKGALVVLCLALVISDGALVLCNPRIEEEPAAASTEHPPPPAAPRSRMTVKLVAVLACSLSAGAIVTGYEVAIVGSLRSTGQLEWTGFVLFGCGVYSLVGGLVFGTLQRSVPVPLIIGLLGLATMPLGLTAGNWWTLTLALAPAAALCGPAFAATANAVSQLVEDGDRATVMSIYGSALAAGAAAGAPLSGAVIDSGGSEAAFAAVGGLGVIVAIAAWGALERGSRRVLEEAASAAPTTTLKR
ncbi:MFS transporter [Streptomyces sp. NPDC032472]|uniref:MFS transporter n=1 Tax=Streptomyces sp. NPDC032472 TaxID=3155018 RepID=UPI0033F9C690